MKVLEDEGKTLAEYFKMDDKEKNKWNKKVREMQIAYQMRMGWNNERLNSYLKDCYVARGRTDNLMFPRKITDVIVMLDTTKEYALDNRKLRDGMRDGRYDSQQNTSNDQQENAANEIEEENDGADEISGGHTYTPLTQDEILAAAMTEGEEQMFTPEDFAKEERAVGAMVAEYSDDDSDTNDMPALTKHCGSNYWSSSDDDSATAEYWHQDDDDKSIQGSFVSVASHSNIDNRNTKYDIDEENHQPGRQLVTNQPVKAIFVQRQQLLVDDVVNHTPKMISLGQIRNPKILQFIEAQRNRHVNSIINYWSLFVRDSGATMNISTKGTQEIELMAASLPLYNPYLDSDTKSYFQQGEQ